MTTPNFSEALRTIRAHVDPTRPPTNRPGLTETVRAIADAFEALQPPADGPHDWDGNAGDGSYQPRCKKCGALREPMDSSDRGCPGKPPAEKRGEVPEPLPEVLPVGTQRVVAGLRETSASTLELERNSFGGPRYRGYSWSGLTNPLDIDWAHYRRTHSPPPSREGEARALPTYSLKFGGMSYDLMRSGDEFATEEDLTAVLKAMPEERRDPLVEPYVLPLVEKAAVVAARHMAEREALQSRAEFWQANHTTLAKELEAVEKDRDEARSRVAQLEEDQLKATAMGWERKQWSHGARKPAPTTSPVDGGIAGFGSRAEIPEGTFAESPSRDSGAPSTRIYCFCNEIAEKPHEHTSKGPPHEQREGQAQEAEAARSTAGQGAGVPESEPAPSVGARDSGRAGSAPSPAAEVVAPVEGQAGGREEGARRMYEIIRARFGIADWATMHGDAKELVLAAYDFAHSEGATEAGKRVAERALAIVRLARNNYGQPNPHAALDHIEEELEALAAELEKR